jgi:hypothetical protein
MFIGIDFKKMCNFDFFFLQSSYRECLFIYFIIISSNFKELTNWKNDILSFGFKIFKDWNRFLLLYVGIVLNLWIIPIHL